MSFTGAAAADQSCFMQKIISRLTIEASIEPDTSGASSGKCVRVVLVFVLVVSEIIPLPSGAASLKSVELTELTAKAVGVKADVLLLANLTVVGPVPGFTMSVTRDPFVRVRSTARRRRSRAPLALQPLAEISVAPFTFAQADATIELRAVVGDSKQTFQAMFDVVKDRPVTIDIAGGRTNGTTVFSRLFNALAFALSFNLNNTDAAPLPAEMTSVLVDKLVLLTADATTLSGDLAVRLPTLTNVSVTASVPDLAIEILRVRRRLCRRASLIAAPQDSGSAIELRFDVDVTTPAVSFACVRSSSSSSVGRLIEPRARSLYADVKDARRTAGAPPPHVDRLSTHRLSFSVAVVGDRRRPDVVADSRSSDSASTSRL